MENRNNIMTDDEIEMTPELEEEIYRKLKESEDRENTRVYTLEEVIANARAAARGALRNVQNKIS
ncbi:MAG: hypothetical protein IJ149_09610 [Oscillospiraceae bacterium]|nr:hypothetical protein [Oscillospiraceae bacterium]